MRNKIIVKFSKFHYLVLTTLVMFALIYGIKGIHHSKAVEGGGIVKGVFVEKIDDVDHEKVIQYGASGLYSVDEMLDKLGIELYDEDRVTAFPDPALGIGSKIEIVRANPVVVNDAGNIETYRTWAQKVGDFIDESGVELGTQDEVSVAMDDKIEKGMEIEITRVAVSEFVEYEDIDYDVIKKDDPTMEKGVTQIEQYPEYGVRELTYEVRRENGEEISRELIGSEITKEPVDKVVLVGTKVIVLDQGGASYVQGYPEMTAAHKTLPMGSKVLVRASNGNEVVVTIVDRGPFVPGRVIDLSEDAFAALGYDPYMDGVIGFVSIEKP